MAHAVTENTTALWTATIKDQAGAVVPASTLTELKLTLYEKVSGDIINSRNSQNVLNANNVTVSEQGVISWELTPADNAIVSGRKTETHVAVFVAKWASGARQLVHQVEFTVTNVNKVP